MEENGRTRLPAPFSLRVIGCLANNVDRHARIALLFRGGLGSEGERAIADLRDETNRWRLGKDRQRGCEEADRLVAKTSFPSTNNTFREIVLQGDERLVRANGDVHRTWCSRFSASLYPSKSKRSRLISLYRQKRNPFDERAS